MKVLKYCFQCHVSYYYSCNTEKYITSLIEYRYGKEVFFAISFGSLAPISREIAPFKCVQGKPHPDLPTLSLKQS